MRIYVRFMNRRNYLDSLNLHVLLRQNLLTKSNVYAILRRYHANSGDLTDQQGRTHISFDLAVGKAFFMA